MERIYLVGAGVIARAHAEGARRHVADLELHVTDPNSATIAAFCSENPQVVVHPSVDEMLRAAPRPNDIVIIATPPGTHMNLAMQALESGRHVLCEKPLGMTFAEARDMVSEAKGRQLLLGDCSMRFFGYGANEALKAALATGVLGEIYHIKSRHLIARGRSGIEYQPETRWFLEKSKAGGGVLFDWGVYDLSTLFEVLAPEAVRIAQAWTARPVTQIDPPGSIDLEHVVGAAMSVRLPGERWVPLSYERGSATHGTEVLLMEIEGTLGAATWQWLPWTNDETSLTITTDLNGHPERHTERFPSASEIHFHHRPLYYFRAAVAGTQGSALVNDGALFNFSVLTSIYDVAADALPREVTRAMVDPQ